MYKPNAKTIKKVENLEKKAAKVLNNMENKLGGSPNFELGRAEKITNSAQMQKYIKDLENLIGNSKIKKVKGQGGDYYVLQREYEKYQKSYKKALVKTEKFENSIRRKLMSKSGYSAYGNLTTLLEKSRITNLKFLKNRNEFLNETKKLEKILNKDFYKIEIGHYKRSYLKTAIQELREMIGIDEKSVATDIMNKIVDRLQNMSFKIFYQNYYSGKLNDINDMYVCKRMLRDGNTWAAAQTAEEIYKGLF